MTDEHCRIDMRFASHVFTLAMLYRLMAGKAFASLSVDVQFIGHELRVFTHLSL